MYPKQESYTEEQDKRSCTGFAPLKRKPKGSLDVAQKSQPPVASFSATVIFQILTFVHMGDNVSDSDESIRETKSTEERAKKEDIETAKVVSDAPTKEESKDHSS